MFAVLQLRSRRQPPAALGISVALHLIAIFLVLRALPEFLLSQPVMVRGSSKITRVLTTPGRIDGQANKGVKARTSRKARHLKPERKAKPEKVLSPTAPEVLGPVLKASALWRIGGYHEIKIALPQVTPPPTIYLSELPEGFQGDIVVEVVINKEGKVVRTRVLQTFGDGLESKVVTALLDWKFKPAMYDGVPVASLQDIYFHFPDSAMP